MNNFIDAKSNGRNYDWDLSIPTEINNVLSNNGCVSSGEEWEYKFYMNFTNEGIMNVEVKFDGSALKSGNFFFEYAEWDETNQCWKETGIHKTKADLWAQIFPTPNGDIQCVIKSVLEWNEIINYGMKNNLVRETISKHEKTSQKRNKGYLIPIGLIAPYLTKIFQQDEQEMIILPKKIFEAIQ